MEDIVGDINIEIFLGQKIRTERIWDMSLT